MNPLTWPSSVDLAQTIAWVATVPLPIQRLAPLMTHSSPSGWRWCAGPALSRSRRAAR